MKVLSEFEDKLQSILGNPDAMDQIMSIARSLTGGTSAPEPLSPCEASSPGPQQSPVHSEYPFPFLNDMDPRILQIGMRLLSEYNRNDDHTVALLNALQPFVREERYAKVDKAVQIAKLSRLIRVALDTFRKGDANFV